MRTLRTPNDFIVEGRICKIGCYSRQCELVGYAIIDIDDTEKCKPHKWRFDGKYIVTDIKCGGGRLYLHALISEISKSRSIMPDHKNRDIWDNRKENLRISTFAQNMQNRGITKRNTSGYKGVGWSKRKNKWFAKIKKMV